MSLNNDIQVFYNLVLRKLGGELRATIILIPFHLFMNNYILEINKSNLLYILKEQKSKLYGINIEHLVSDNNLCYNDEFSILDTQGAQFSGFLNDFEVGMRKNRKIYESRRYPLLIVHSCYTNISKNTGEVIQKITEAFMDNII